MSETPTTLPSPLKSAIILLGSFVAITWGLEIVDAIPGINFDAFGVKPRSVSGLIGILFMPFLHGGFDHLIANTTSFLIFGTLLILTYGAKRFVMVSVLTALMAGFAVWCFGATRSNHIGASAMIFGYFGYLLAYGFVRRNLKGIVLSLVVGIGYGSLIFGVLPGQKGISWEGHLFGFLAGAVVAFWLGRRERLKEEALL